MGEIFKNARIEKGYTQVQLARKAEITAQGVSGYEKNLKYPREKTLKKVCLCLNLEFDKMVNMIKKQLIEVYKTEVDKKTPISILKIKIIDLIRAKKISKKKLLEIFDILT